MLKAESPTRSRISLPAVPAEWAGDAVAAWSQPVVIDSYLPADPDTYPAFLDSRVYQGSSGRVYPLPFHERISQHAVPHEWQAVHLENEWIRIMILPELGGRIHVAWDKVAEYDIFYRNNVIKPALVGLAGPWISGGVEFNWPQHHRPGTFLPTDTWIEREPDGAITVWSSDHDPFARMKGMHGIRLRPDSALIEARVRLFNRSEVPQSFLWWANVAAAVGDDYQSFFPTDVTRVADHARRAVTTFPAVDGRYYGVDYPARVDESHPDADRLDWYRNIPVPTSYMVLSTEDEFFGGYDHARQAGFVHWASRDVAPGKKQWTWGNAEFGWAWDANLTDDDGPYVELMAGVFTDNQPDFAWLAPGETKTFSQFWYAIQKIGPVQQATREAAASLSTSVADGAVTAHVGVVVTSVVDEATITLRDGAGTAVFAEKVALRPAHPYLADVIVPQEHGLCLSVESEGASLVRIEQREPREELRESAVEPPTPDQVPTTEQLYLVGQYLEQYRHATRSPEPYWAEALRRDPSDVRSNIALGARRYAAGRFEEAAAMFELAIARETTWVPTPASGEAHYRLGMTLLRLGRADRAQTVLARASWDAAWRVPSTLALARVACTAANYHRALEYLEDLAVVDPQHLQARDLRARVLRQLGRDTEASELVAATLALDPLDQWALDLAGGPSTRDAPTLLDIALEYASAGFVSDALRVLDAAAAVVPERAVGQVEVGPLIAYHRAALLIRENRLDEARIAAAAARDLDSRYCLASRLDDIDALELVLQTLGADALASALLGHWYYDRGRFADAIAAWQDSLAADPPPGLRAIVHRNLGIASYNVLRDPAGARAQYESALAVAETDSRLWYEFDQLCARLGDTSARRLERLESRPLLVRERDDLCVTVAGLLIDEGRAQEALDLLSARTFQPWEGGEGQAIAAWDRATLALAGAALSGGDARRALDLLMAARHLPANLGEARHPLANSAALDLALGDAHAGLGDRAQAEAEWRRAAEADGDFMSMRTREFSAQTYYSVLALRRLGEADAAAELVARFAAYIDRLAVERASVDYFATSLPTMLLFTDDPQVAHDLEVAALREKLRRLGLPAREDQTASGAVETGWQ